MSQLENVTSIAEGFSPYKLQMALPKLGKLIRVIGDSFGKKGSILIIIYSIW